MRCPNCNTQYGEGKNFCSKCGSPLVQDVIQRNNMPQIEDTVTTKKKNIKKIAAIGVATVLLAVSCLCGGYFLAQGTSRGQNDGIGNKDGNNIVDKKEEMLEHTVEPTPTPLTFEEQIEKLNTDGSAYLVTLENQPEHTLLREENDKHWDPSVFYGIDNPTEKYPEIPCTVEARKLGDSDRDVIFWVYRSTGTGNIIKISSFEDFEDGTNQQTDYYYTEEQKVSFVFSHHKKTDFLPTYATSKENGERYYYKDDSFVRLRSIVDGVQDNYTTSQTEITNMAEQSTGATWYWMISSSEKEEMKKVAKKQKAVSGAAIKFLIDDEDGIETEYFQKGQAMLQQAYDVLAAIKITKPVNILEGTVWNNKMQDTDEEYVEEAAGLEGVNVRLFLDSSNQKLWETTTDESGHYVFYIPSEESRRYRLEMEKDGYVTETYYRIDSNIQSVDISQGDIYLCDRESSEREVCLFLKDATGYDRAGEETTVKIRRGINNFSGEVYRKANMFFEEDSYIQALEPGNYTLEIGGVDYENTYRNICYSNEEVVRILICPKLEEDEVRVVLEWGDYPDDLDSHMFLPGNGEGYSEDENPYHIWYGNKEEHPNGDLLDIDDMDGEGPETVTLHQVNNDVYRYYVVDYTHYSDNDYQSDAMSYSNATVTVYTHGQEPKVFSVPENRSGVVWEVFKMKNKEIIPVNHYYDMISARPSWLKDKWEE